MSTAVEVNLRQEPLVLETDLDSWLLSIKAKIGGRILNNLKTDTDSLDQYIEFAELKDLPGAFIACSFYQQTINDALTRAGIFMGAGKGVKARTLLPHRDCTLVNYKKLVAGHNLPGSVLRDFFSSIETSIDLEVKANAAEAAVAKAFLRSARLMTLKESFYLIGFSIQSMKDQKSIISHEIFHAQSFLNSKYREVIFGFWRDVVSAEDKISITKEIGLAYNVDDENLVVDEFQAYLIQSRAEFDRMKTFVPKYRALLLKRLDQFNVKIMKI